jgi:hypothetical protein
MHALTLIQAQLNGIHQLFHEYAGDLTATEWTKPVFPRANLLGFTCWHLVRTWDWAVQTAIRGVPEVIADERWAGWSELQMAGFGAGIPLEQANEIAHLVSRTDVLAYADTVHSIIQNWLSCLSDDELGTIPEMEAHMAAYLAYQLPGSREETDDLLGQPIWRLLSGPCIGHLRGHLGELDTLKQILRGSVGQI